MTIDENGILHGTTTCLWEAITMLGSRDGKPFSREKAYNELQYRLGQCASLSGQEIGVTPTPEGWVIHVNACYEDGKVDILIPKDRNAPVQILKDTRATSEAYERYENP